MATLATSELIWLALTLVASGIVMGLFAGLFGVGGGAIVIPVLYEVFRITGVPEEVRMPLCVGTSLAIIVPTSISSFRYHHSRGAADLSVLRRWCCLRPPLWLSQARLHATRPSSCSRSCSSACLASPRCGCCSGRTDGNSPTRCRAAGL